MEKAAQHLLFYDGTCGLCHGAVNFVLKHDTNKIFAFAPLQGETASQLLKQWHDNNPAADTLVLMENYNSTEKCKINTYSRAAFRIFWLLGGIWKVLGVASFLPSLFFDWAYTLVASRRFDWFGKQSCMIPPAADPNRFLP